MWNSLCYRRNKSDTLNRDQHKFKIYDVYTSFIKIIFTVIKPKKKKL